MRMLTRIAIVACCLAAAAPAQAADPGRWVRTARTFVVTDYRQGVASDAVHVYFAGPFQGVYRTATSTLREQARNSNAIPGDVQQREGYNHVGDITLGPTAPAAPSLLLLPLECYQPLQQDSNGCHTGSIGVVDPATLRWRFYVKLDPAEVPKAMWLAADPASDRVWTSAGPDLLAYRLSDVAAANAAPGGPVLHAVARLADAVPPGGIAGGAVVGGRLFVSNQDGSTISVFSIDPATGSRVLEIERPAARGQEVEGLDLGGWGGGILHLEVAGGVVTPVDLSSYLPAGIPLRVAAGPRVKAARRAAVRVRVTASANGYKVAVPGVRVSLDGKHASTDASGNAVLRVKLRRGRHMVSATRRGLRAGRATVRAT
ncbi:MAG: hypothetical protein ACJ76Z_04370 [Thermoleophilaceae bacterium]